MPERFGRRHLLALSAAFAATLRAQNQPDFDFPTEPRRRLAVSTYPFRSVIGSGTLLEDFARSIRPKLQVSAIEPWSHHFESTDTAYVQGLNAAFKSARLLVVNIPVDVPAKLCGSSEERRAALETYHKWVDAAVILGSPSIRVHLPHGESGAKISCSVSAMQELAGYGASRNIVINIENDEPEIEQPERVARVIQTVNSPFLHSLPDFCNSMLVHDDPEYDYHAMALLFPLAYNISHVKDEETDNGKVYRVDVDRIFWIAKNAGYRGFFSMEWEGTGDPYEGTAKLIAASLRNLS